MLARYLVLAPCSVSFRSRWNKSRPCTTLANSNTRTETIVVQQITCTTSGSSPLTPNSTRLHIGGNSPQISSQGSGKPLLKSSTRCETLSTRVRPRPLRQALPNLPPSPSCTHGRGWYTGLCLCTLITPKGVRFFSKRSSRLLISIPFKRLHLGFCATLLLLPFSPENRLPGTRMPRRVCGILSGRLSRLSKQKSTNIKIRSRPSSRNSTLNLTLRLPNGS